MGWKFRQIHRFAIEKHIMNKAQRVRHREYARYYRDQRHHPAEIAELVLLQGLGEKHLLAQETVQQGHAGHRRGRNHSQRGGMRSEEHTSELQSREKARMPSSA